MKDIFGTLEEAAVEVVEEAVKAPSTSKLRSMFKRYLDSCRDHRELAFRDRRYFDGDQIGEQWQKHLEKEELPMVPINLIKDNIQAHIGLVASQQADIRAFARTEAGVAASGIATKLIRYGLDAAQVDAKIREAAANYFIEGISIALIECSESELFFTPIDFRDFAYDPDSRRSDFSDARWLGFSRWLPAEDVADAYPEAFLRLSPTGATADFQSIDQDSGFEKDTKNEWLDERKMVRVIEMYYLEAGQWMHAVWCHRGVLEHGPSPYTSDQGVSLCPLVAEACFTKADPDAVNERYGVVRDLIYPQDDYNARRHAALKYAMAKVIQQVDPNAAPVDAETLRAESRKRESIMPPGYQSQDVSMSAEQVQYMQMAGAEIQRLSPAAAVTGANLPDDASGRSRQFAAAGGRLSLTPVMNRFQDWRNNIYRQAWYRIHQYWRGQMEVRVSGDVEAPKFLNINVPQVEEAQEPIVDPATGQPAIDPYTGQAAMQTVSKVVGVENEVAKIDVDFTIETVEKHNNLEQEVWDSLMNLMSSLSLRPGTPEFRMALDWAPIPDKARVIERYDAQMAKQAEESAADNQMQQQLAQMQMQLQMLMDQSKADKDASAAMANKAKAERTSVETAMLADNYNQEKELAMVAAQRLFR